ncbi:MAG: redoxin domain-containing protein, partial [Actinobacteria bacterium]|nr:redoxin domain-containing protein [Actinomycetota bacterium]
MSHPSPVGAGRPAPELAVRGMGPEAVSIGELAGGGCALLLFVSEECPTSAMALRRLGPLCRDWEAAGLASAAVFEDPLEVAVRVARRLGWTGRVLSQEPPYQTSRAYGLVSVPTAVLVDRAGTVAGSVTGWDQPSLQALVASAGTILGARLTGPPNVQPLQKPGCASKAALDPELAAAVSAPAGTDDIEEMFERGWTDGLPVVPP